MLRVLVTKIAQTGSIPLELGLADDSVTAPWEQRAESLESFYDSSQTW